MKNQNKSKLKKRIQGIFSTKLEAFTLIEVLFTLIIIGFITYMVMPDYSSLTAKAKATEAKLQLEHMHMLEKTYYYQYSKYSTSFTDIGFQQAKLVTEGGNANYKMEIIEAGPAAFKVQATAVVDFNNDGKMNVWTMDQDKNLKEVTPD